MTKRNHSNRSTHRPEFLFYLSVLLCSAVLTASVSGCVESPVETAAEAAEESVDESMPITLSDLHRRDQHWHNIAAITEPWQPPGEDRVIPEKAQGVLVRVEPDGHARVDLGRYGMHWVPVEKTDVLDRANRVRSGELHKIGSVFTLAIANRLVDSRFDKPGPNPSAPIKMAEAILCVFADPEDAKLPRYAEQLRRFEGDLGLRTIFVPQAAGALDLEAVLETLQENEWPVPFTYPGASASFTELQLGEQPEGIVLMLVTPDGRVLYRSEPDEQLGSAKLVGLLGSLG